MFATTLVVEREPLSWADLPVAVQSWLLAAGGFAAAGLAVWLLAAAIQALGAPPGRRNPLRSSWVLGSVTAGVCLAAVAAGMPWVWHKMDWEATGAALAVNPTEMAQVIASMK